MLSEIILAQKDKYCIISLICGSRKVDVIEVENKIMDSKAWKGCGRRELEREWLRGTGLMLGRRNNL
jgi:hypothetical protein